MKILNDSEEAVFKDSSAQSFSLFALIWAMSWFNVFFKFISLKSAFVTSVCQRALSASRRAVSELDVLSDVERLWDVFACSVYWCVLSSSRWAVSELNVLSDVERLLNVFACSACLRASLIAICLRFELSVFSSTSTIDEIFVLKSIIIQSKEFSLFLFFLFKSVLVQKSSIACLLRW